ncbi:hypothetical protein LMG26824_01384 [Stenotrophomonas maltophilia]
MALFAVGALAAGSHHGRSGGRAQAGGCAFSGTGDPPHRRATVGHAVGGRIAGAAVGLGRVVGHAHGEAAGLAGLTGLVVRGVLSRQQRNVLAHQCQVLACGDVRRLDRQCVASIDQHIAVARGDRRSHLGGGLLGAGAAVLRATVADRCHAVAEASGNAGFLLALVGLTAVMVLCGGDQYVVARPQNHITSGIDHRTNRSQIAAGGDVDALALDRRTDGITVAVVDAARGSGAG